MFSIIVFFLTDKCNELKTLDTEVHVHLNVVDYIEITQ